MPDLAMLDLAVRDGTLSISRATGAEGDYIVVKIRAGDSERIAEIDLASFGAAVTGLSAQPCRVRDRAVPGHAGAR